MDITLSRILSLIPRKENGKFQHGALAQFARGLGFKDGHIVSEWISGTSVSYKNYLYQIAALHHVSVAWLRGETDDRTPEMVTKNGVSTPKELNEIYPMLTPDRRAYLDRQAQMLWLEQQSGIGAPDSQG